MSTHGQRVAPGRVVHFVMGDDSIRPAQIVRIWGPDPTGEEIHYSAGNPEGMYSSLQLMVTLDGTNDTPARYSLENLSTWMKAALTPPPTSAQAWSKRKAIEQFIAQNKGATPLFQFAHHQAPDPQNDMLSIYSVVEVQGFLGWATSISYDPYDWKPRTWHWPQDRKLTRPASMEAAVTA